MMLLIPNTQMDSKNQKGGGMTKKHYLVDNKQLWKSVNTVNIKRLALDLSDCLWEKGIPFRVWWHTWRVTNQ